MSSSLAFVLPSITSSAVQSDDVMDLLLYAGARVEQHLRDCPNEALEVRVLTNDRSNDGWARVKAEIAPLAHPICRVEAMPQPAVPCIGERRLRETYQLLEHLKANDFDEVHYLDRGGVGFFPTQARRLGLALPATTLVAHIVGGAVFRSTVEDRPMHGEATLVEDLLERGSVARSDELLVHDERAWDWYAGRIDVSDGARVHRLRRRTVVGPRPEVQRRTDPAATAIAFHGPLGNGGALPLFGDTLDHLAAKHRENTLGAVLVVGRPGPVGGIDAASYVRIRQQRWKRSVTLRLDLSIADELALLRDRAGTVVCDPRRRDTLRARLLLASHPSVVTVSTNSNGGSPGTGTPAALADAIVRSTRPLTSAGLNYGPDVSRSPAGTVKLPLLDLMELWHAAHELPTNFEPTAPEALDRLTDGPLVSVCVTHHQRPAKLRTALRSLETQTYRNFEVVIVDDGSPDPEVQAELSVIEREIAPRGWKVVRQPNLYLGAARNTAVRHASGEFLLFMDDDNAARPQELETLVSVQRRTGADVVTCFCDVFEDDTEPTDDLPPRLRFTPMGSDVALGLVNNCFGDANALWSRASFERLGGFTEDWGVTHEDWELFCRAALEGMDLVCVPEPLFWYRIDTIGMSRGPRKQVLEVANRHRHLRPYVDKLPHGQAVLAQLVQELAMPQPADVVSERTAEAIVRAGQPTRYRPFARVAVVMRTKDRPLLLRRAVESVVNQTYADLLLVVVNDGGDPEMVELVLNQFDDELRDRLLVIHHPFSMGMQTSSNAALARSDSEFVVVHDDDDSWNPTFLARTVSHLDDNAWRPTSGAVVTWSTLVTERVEADSGEIVTIGRHLYNQIGSIGLVDMAIENRFPPISFLFRRSVLDAVGPFEEEHGPLGDWEFNLRVLERYDIDVVTEALANYHHRPVTSAGLYGNSVHAQQATHAARRVNLVNRVLRSSASDSDLARTLVAGEFQHQAMLASRHEFQRIQDGLWNLDQRVAQLSRKVDPPRPGRNLVPNGDFREAFSPGEEILSAEGDWVYRVLNSGVTLSYDGEQVAYRVDVRKWSDSSGHVPLGKNYLRLEKDAGSRRATWFVLQLHVASDVVAGKPICISGRGRLDATPGWVEVCGRHELRVGEHVPWASNQIWLGEEFTSFETVFPSALTTPHENGQAIMSHVLFRLPHQAAFVLEITDLQLEIGVQATEFEFRSSRPSPRGTSPREQLRRLASKGLRRS